MPGPVLALQGIQKRFGSVEALRGADFVLGAGEVHGLLGENGAGKSTLMHVAFGLTQPDAGTMLVRGAAQRVRSPSEAKRLGFGMVHQHFTSIPTLSVEENLRLAGGAPESTSGFDPIRSALAAGIDPGALVEQLTVGQQQRLEVLKALATDAEILLLDEPTAVLAPTEVRELLALLRQFAVDGGSVVLITHKLDEALAAADTVTVLRHGEVTWSGPVQDASKASLARAMIGGVVANATPQPPRHSPTGPPRVQLGGIEVRGGEIVGIAGVEGNGQRSLLRAIAGLEARPPNSTVTEPVAFVPEDRTNEGLIPAFSLTENLVLGLETDPRWVDGPWLRWPAARRRTEQLLEEFSVRAAGPGVAARTLSGGNQQKFVFARALEGAPAVVVAENPTRGLDLKATAFVHARLRTIAAGGVAVVVYSSDLDEVLDLADRVVVMFRGKACQVPRGASKELVGSMMVGAAE